MNFGVDTTGVLVGPMNFLVKVVNIAKEVFKEELKGRHVKIWDYFIVKIVPKHPRNPKHVLEGGRK